MNVLAALAEAEPTPYWLTDPAAPEPAPALVGSTSCDLAVVGAGYTGLWTALRAKERDPSLDVVIVEADVAGGAASGRNGGFCAASLTHGLGNGLARWRAEMPVLERLGRENLDGIEDTVRRHGIDCDFERTGELSVATEDWQLAALRTLAEESAALGRPADLLDADAVQAEIASPTYKGGLWDRDGVAMVHPAKLAWGLRRACLAAGVRLYERTPVDAVEDEQHGRLRLRTPYGSVDAAKVAVGTGAFAGPLRRLRHFAVPVYDYALVTEPLSADRLASIGWRNRQGVGDGGNQFHYYRLTADGRILWGGYDAIYHFGGGVASELERRPQTFATLARHFFATFPQLEGVRFSHAWGGMIDTCSRFCAFYGTAYGGRLAYAAGYTGLGVGATRFGADVMLDLLSGADTERTRLEMVRSRPMPFPPEPLRYGVIQLTRWSLARADQHQGRRNLWLRTLDHLGVGFDS
ncbi:FAD-dependent oxidoreductase [Actinoallomurus sp. NPDC052274]|uniref:NAD(P)/FAD-dependent oxidoreductase n=1 Tax=Actinoallomurus sp. NPDC052274 TaxID=3155420 RepID=UPI0034383E4F